MQSLLVVVKQTSLDIGQEWTHTRQREDKKAKGEKHIKKIKKKKKAVEHSSKKMEELEEKGKGAERPSAFFFLSSVQSFSRNTQSQRGTMPCSAGEEWGRLPLGGCASRNLGKELVTQVEKKASIQTANGQKKEDPKKNNWKGKRDYYDVKLMTSCIS